ncbi:M20/M25/M40 family metallo-hydrolase [Acetobacteraceae bacterium KSS8]|uniref:M20/M25/M40 family metallo-hydrolase n=1 Tax=Endosaccharibacter trunci TaxID=2812733 RepID=A0ABT1W6K7_9PROT|nr:M20/M25/M40 family metallo-hydrolase [Acetobacteraceae bacterium KSS8]
MTSEPLDALVTETLALLSDWTRHRSVAGNVRGLRDMGEAVRLFLTDEIGADCLPAAAGDAPVIHARIDRGAPATLLLYNMYDVMPADEPGWSVDPFAGAVVDLAPFGRCFVGRGAENNKGPLAGMLVALRHLLRHDGLDANIEIVLDGQEETGSTALRRFLAAPDCPVRRADAGLFPSFCEYGGGAPRLYLGSKAIVRGKIACAGGAWGGPRRPIHSSNSPWIDNPAWALTHALSALATDRTGHWGAIALDDEAKQLVKALAAVFDPQAELAFRSTARFADIAPDGMCQDEEFLLTHVLASANLNVTSLAAEAGAGSGTIPASAEATFELRLPPGMEPATMIDRLAGALRPHPGVDLSIEEAYPGHRFGRHAHGVQALHDVYVAHGITPQLWPWTIGAMPCHAFSRVADSFLIGGLGHGGNAHGPDEFVTLHGLSRFLSSLLAWLPATARSVVAQAA